MDHSDLDDIRVKKIKYTYFFFYFFTVLKIPVGSYETGCVTQSSVRVISFH